MHPGQLLLQGTASAVSVLVVGGVGVVGRAGGRADVPQDAALELVVESVQAPPARSLVLVLGAASVTVYAEGLMSYGPTRQPLPPHAASRVRRVLHLDLVRGLRPLDVRRFDGSDNVVLVYALDGASRDGVSAAR